MAWTQAKVCDGHINWHLISIHQLGLGEKIVKCEIELDFVFS